MNAHTFPQSTCHACPPPTGNGEPHNPCPLCGNHINPHIAATSPDCPHGWEDVTGAADLADLYAETWATEGDTP